MKSSFLPLYYVAVIAVLLTQTVYAVYNQGLFIFATDSVHDLKQEKQELLKEQLVLRNDLARSTALTSVLSYSGINDFEAMQKPLVIKSHDNLALSL